MSDAPRFSDDDLKKALRAFRKRLKAAQLEEDSRLGRGPLSADKDKVTAIQPPVGFGKEIWLELARLGLLSNDGGGLYKLPPGQTNQ